MTISRRDAISISASTLAGLSLEFRSGAAHAQNQAPAAVQTQKPPESWPEQLVERPLRQGFPAPLPLNVDSSAPEYPASASGPITNPVMWRTANKQAPLVEYDFQKLKVKVDTRGLGKLAGTLRFADLEKLPRVTHTFLLQCGSPNRRGIVTWTGVRFGELTDALGLVVGAHYCRFVASDGYYIDEAVATLRDPQVMLAWMMNDAPIPPQHGAPLRLIIPFRYGSRSIKAVTEILFGTPSLPASPA